MITTTYSYIYLMTLHTSFYSVLGMHLSYIQIFPTKIRFLFCYGLSLSTLHISVVVTIDVHEY
jgi:hypothetical protein